MSAPSSRSATIGWLRRREDLAQRFTQLAVFPADFLADAAAAVWELSSVEAQTALDGLLARSLLQLEGELRRYRLHDLLRDLAREKADPPILGEAEQRHAEHYLAVLSMTQNLYLAGADKLLEALRLFDAERTNIEAGQAWAATRVETNNDAAWLAFEYTNAGVYVPSLRLTLQQQIHWLEIALVGCRRTGNRRGEGGVLGNLGRHGTPSVMCGRRSRVMSRRSRLHEKTATERLRGHI